MHASRSFTQVRKKKKPIVDIQSFAPLGWTSHRWERRKNLVHIFKALHLWLELHISEKGKKTKKETYARSSKLCMHRLELQKGERGKKTCYLQTFMPTKC